jgi:hypothetical protein
VVGGTPTGAVTATVTDSLSGPVAGTVSRDVTAADVATPGVKSISLTGEDLAGNQTAANCPFVVGYDFIGFLEPIPQTSFRRGSTIPVRFMLGGATGTPISDAAAAALLSPVCLVRITFDGVDKGCARYNAVANTFQLDLKTTKSVVVGTHTVGILVRAGDGSGVVNNETTTISIR